MLEYFTYRKFKRHQDAKDSGAKEVLTPADEKYFESVVSSPGAQEVSLQGSHTPASTASPTDTPADGNTPAASETSAQPKKGTWKDTASVYATGAYGKATETYEKARQVKLAEHIPAFLHKKEKSTDSTDKGKEGEPSKKDKKEKKEKEKKDKGKGKMTKEDEVYFGNLTPEEKELHDVLDALDLAAQDGKAFSLSAETRGILKDFTQILKDMINGVPTAYDDLIKLFESKSKQLDTMFEQMPGFLKGLAKKIPSALGMTEKALEVGEEASAGAKLAAHAATLGIPTLQQIATKPTMIADALKTVVSAIELRFPGIILGTNVIVSMALFVLLFVFWYCWKRGKEVRLEKERLEQEAEDAKITQSVLEEAPAVPTTDPSTSATTTTNTTIDEVVEVPPRAQTEPAAVGSSASLPRPVMPVYAPPEAKPVESKPEKQIKDLF
ncbi:hypothetical protein ABW20_dc0102941 [Dactylellina cionopaga]|nr:hypothetical protein ABW20_dc0102941 [Dactylellina cionopaga]